jgi:hypothetical protein
VLGKPIPTKQAALPAAAKVPSTRAALTIIRSSVEIEFALADALDNALVDALAIG